MWRIRWKFQGGGPAPLLENPSMAYLIILFGLSVVQFIIATIAIIYESSSQQTCAYPLWEFMVALGFLSLGMGAWFLKIGRISSDSDTAWIVYGGVSIVLNVVQLVTTIVGFGYVVAAAADDICKTEAKALLVFSLVQVTFFTITVACSMIGIYLLYIPSFISQLRSRRDFK